MIHLTVMDESLDRVNEIVLATPLHAGAHLRIVEQSEEGAVVRFDVTELLSGPGRKLHGGALYALMDAACYLALAPLLAGDHAVSHDAHFSIVRPVDVGATVEIRARVERRGRTVAFLRAEAHRVADANPLVGLGTVTKTIIKAK